MERLHKDIAEEIISRSGYSEEGDSIILEGEEVPISKDRFHEFGDEEIRSSLGFVDGGQADLFITPGFSLQFIRVYGCIFDEDKNKVRHQNDEFYVLSTCSKEGGKMVYEGEVFSVGSEDIIDEDLRLTEESSIIRYSDQKVKTSAVGDIARRISELSMASSLSQEASDVVLDGALRGRSDIERKYVKRLPENVCGLSKTCDIVTNQGYTATGALEMMGADSRWSFTLDSDSDIERYFVKLHPGSDYVFYFESFSGVDMLGSLSGYSDDPVFLGYPYGLIWVDKNARVSKSEADMLRAEIGSLINQEDRRRVESSMNAVNAHDILDSISY